MSSFSGREGRIAAIINALQAQQTQGQIDDRLKAGQSGALGAIDASEPLRLGAIDTGEAKRVGAIEDGYTTMRADLERARDRFNPFAETGTRALGASADAAGLNGQEGHDRALTAFHAGPSYDWDQTESADRVARAATATGQLISGNEMTEVQDRSHNLANREFGTYYDRLKGLADTGERATTAQAGLDGEMGRAAYGYGADRAGVYGDTAGQRSAVFGDDATQRAAVYTGTAAAGANAVNRTGDRLIDANNSAYESGQRAGENRVNLGLGLANAAAGIAGKYVGGKAASGKSLFDV